MKKRFFYHYNKAQTQQRSKVTWSVHFDDKCHFVNSITCMVPTSSKINKRQPKGVIVGYCNKISIIEEPDNTFALIE